MEKGRIYTRPSTENSSSVLYYYDKDTKKLTENSKLYSRFMDKENRIETIIIKHNTWIIPDVEIEDTITLNITEYPSSFFEKLKVNKSCLFDCKEEKSIIDYKTIKVENY